MTEREQFRADIILRMVERGDHVYDATRMARDAEEYVFGDIGTITEQGWTIVALKQEIAALKAAQQEGRG